MSSWYGTARSNYVKIDDMAGLEAALKPFCVKITPQDTDPAVVYFTPEDSDTGGWQTFSSDDDDGEEIEFNPVEHICPFMADGQVLVMMEAGAERLRYVTGEAQAYNKQGDFVCLSLSDIYAKAAEAFGVPKASITTATY